MARKQVNPIKSAQEAIETLGRELSIAASSVTLHTYRPHDKQKTFHSSSHDVRLYIGGNRSGKTLGGVIEDVYWLRKDHPNQRLPIGAEPTRGRVVAVDFENGVKKIILPIFANVIPKSLLINGSWLDSYNGQEKTLKLSNNSFVEFMSYDQDLDKFAGTSRHFIHMDEEPPKPIYTENYARIIDTNGRLWITMTPVEGMTWIFDTIYEPGILGKNPNVKVIVVDMTENPYLSNEARQKFIDSLDAEDVEARIHGRFVQMGGLIYKTFDPTPGGEHVVPKSIKPPKNWEVVLGLDHGFNNPTAVGWHMISPEGDIITYAEHYQSGLTIEENAQAIKQEILRQGRMPDYFVADPSIKNVQPITGTSILQEYGKYGLNFTLGVNDVKAGIVRVQWYLKPRKTLSGKKIIPKYHVTTDCPMHIKEFTRYRWKTYKNRADQFDHNNFEEPHKKDDHAMDQLRYVIMSRPDLRSEKDNEAPPPNHRSDEFMVPSAVGFGATASDFHSMGNGPEGNEYSHIGEGSGIEYDEHLGGVW